MTTSLHYTTEILMLILSRKPFLGVDPKRVFSDFLQFKLILSLTTEILTFILFRQKWKPFFSEHEIWRKNHVFCPFFAKNLTFFSEKSQKNQENHKK